MKHFPCKIIFLSLIFLSSLPAAQTNTLYFPIADIGQAGKTNVRVTLTLLKPNPRIYNGLGIRQDPVWTNTLADATAYFTNILWGNYRVDVAGVGTSFPIFVGTNTLGLVNGWTCYTNAAAVPPDDSTLYYTKAQVDALLSGLETGGSAADRVATNAGTIYNGTNVGLFTLNGEFRTANVDNRFTFVAGGLTNYLDDNGIWYATGFVGDLNGNAPDLTNLLASGIYTGMNKSTTGRTVWDFANVSLSQAGALFAGDDLSAGGDVIATGQFIGDAGGLTNWPGLVVTNADATLSGNQLTTGDGGRGIRATNLTATVLGASSGVPYSATAAQIGGLFSGGSTYLKADGTTGTGGTSGSASTNYFHPDDYGALGDGTTVDDNAVSNAWRAAWTAGGVFSMEGRGKTYVVSNFCFTVVGSSPSTVGFSAPIFRGGGSILRHVGTNWLMRFTNACPDIEGLHVFATGNSPGGILILGPPSNGRLLSTTFYGYTNGTAIMAEGLTSWNVEAWAAYCYRAFGFGAYCDGSEMRLRADHCTFSVDQGCTNAFWQYTPQGPVGGKWTIVGNYNGDCVLTPARGVLEVNAAFESCTNAFVALGHNLARHGYDNTAQGAGTLMLSFAGGFGNPALGGTIPANWTNCPIEVNCVGTIVGRGALYGTGHTNAWFINRNAQADTANVTWEGNSSAYDLRNFMQLSTGERIKARNIPQRMSVNQTFRLLQTDSTLNSGYDMPLLSAMAKYAGSATDVARIGYASDISGTNMVSGLYMRYAGGGYTVVSNTYFEINGPNGSYFTADTSGNLSAPKLPSIVMGTDSSGKIQSAAAAQIILLFPGDLLTNGYAAAATISNLLYVANANGRVGFTNSGNGNLALSQTGASTNASMSVSNLLLVGTLKFGNISQPVILEPGNSLLGFKMNNSYVATLRGNGGNAFSLIRDAKLGWDTSASGGSPVGQPTTYFITNGLGTIEVHTNLYALGFIAVGANGPAWSTNQFQVAVPNNSTALAVDTNGNAYVGSGQFAQTESIRFPQRVSIPTNAVSSNTNTAALVNLTNVGPAFVSTNAYAAGSFTTKAIATDSEYLAQLTEEFFGGGNASFQIGELGWRNISGGNGTPGAIASEANHPGIFRASTAGSANSYSGFALSQSTSQSGFILSDGDGSWTFIFRPSSTNNTDTAVGFAPPATHFIATASPNTLAWNTANICVVSTNGSPWYLHARNAAGGPESWVSTGVASQSAGWVKAKFRWNAANSIMYLSVNDSAEVSASGASLPSLSALRDPVFQIITSDTNARDLDVDFFWAKQTVTR